MKTTFILFVVFEALATILLLIRILLPIENKKVKQVSIIANAILYVVGSIIGCIFGVQVFLRVIELLSL